MKAMDEKCLALHVELAKEKKLREEAEERQAKEIQDEINRLTERIDRECRDREGQEDGIIKKASPSHFQPVSDMLIMHGALPAPSHVADRPGDSCDRCADTHLSHFAVER